MYKQIAALLIWIFLVDSSQSTTICQCKNFANKIYQLKTTLTNRQPFYTFITLLPNGIFYETSNIANGKNTAEIGTEFLFNVHSGYYSCLSGNKLRLTSFGYIYKKSDNSLLSTNGATGVHYYDLQFLNNDNRQCSGLFNYALYTTGSNPFDSSNVALSISRNNTATCQLFNGKDYQLL